MRNIGGSQRCRVSEEDLDQAWEKDISAMARTNKLSQTLYPCTPQLVSFLSAFRGFFFSVPYTCVFTVTVLIKTTTSITTDFTHYLCKNEIRGAVRSGNCSLTYSLGLPYPICPFFIPSLVRTAYGPPTYPCRELRCCFGAL